MKIIMKIFHYTELIYLFLFYFVLFLFVLFFVLFCFVFCFLFLSHYWVKFFPFKNLNKQKQTKKNKKQINKQKPSMPSPLWISNGVPLMPCQKEMYVNQHILDAELKLQILRGTHFKSTKAPRSSQGAPETMASVAFIKNQALIGCYSVCVSF